MAGWLDYPVEMLHLTIKAVQEFDDWYSVDFAEGGGTGIQKFECSRRPEIGERCTLWSHGLGSPNFRFMIGERIIRDKPIDWRGTPSPTLQNIGRVRRILRYSHGRHKSRQ